MLLKTILRRRYVPGLLCYDALFRRVNPTPLRHLASEHFDVLAKSSVRLVMLFKGFSCIESASRASEIPISKSPSALA